MSATQTRIGAIAGKNIVQKGFLAEFHAGRVAALQIQEPRQIKDDGELGNL
jgi:hypothetical protein